MPKMACSSMAETALSKALQANSRKVRKKASSCLEELPEPERAKIVESIAEKARHYTNWKDSQRACECLLKLPGDQSSRHVEWILKEALRKQNIKVRESALVFLAKLPQQTLLKLDVAEEIVKVIAQDPSEELHERVHRCLAKLPPQEITRLADEIIEKVVLYGDEEACACIHELFVALPSDKRSQLSDRIITMALHDRDIVGERALSLLGKLSNHKLSNASSRSVTAALQSESDLVRTRACTLLVKLPDQEHV